MVGGNYPRVVINTKHRLGFPIEEKHHKRLRKLKHRQLILASNRRAVCGVDEDIWGQSRRENQSALGRIGEGDGEGGLRAGNCGQPLSDQRSWVGRTP